MNKCLDCEHKSKTARWIISDTNKSIYEEFDVEECDDGTFNLDTIDIDKLVDKYNADYCEVYDLIFEGEAACPVCGSLNYYIDNDMEENVNK